MSKPRHRSALALVAATLAGIFQPPAVIAPSAWAKANLVIADGPRAGSHWDPALTPQLVPILDALQPGAAWNKVVHRKSAQVGATSIGIAWLAYIIANAPARGMVIFPTTTSVHDYAREKLTPTIAASPELRRRVREQTSRSARGSTALTKVFSGGSITLTGANSAADLRSKTVKYQHRDEVDEWPLDLDGQGDPMAMADARFIAFHASGDYMAFESSTPTIKGRSRIDAGFEAGTQNYWHVPCPQCGTEQRLVFGGADTAHGLKFNQEPPYKAHYVCLNGCVIEHHHKAAMVRAGRFVPANEAKGLHPSFHTDALSSLLTTWDKVAEAFVAAKDDPTKLKAFVNLWLGESWEERGEAPEWKRLYDRRETYPTGVLPVGVLVLTLAMDVQKNGLFYEVVGWGADKQSWSIAAGFLEGDTADPEAEVWRQATALWEQRYPDAYGNHWRADLTGVDAGYNSQAVYAWVRGKPQVMALKGQPGWMLPAIGTPTKVDVSFGGKKVVRGMHLWPVGTWPLKGEFYANLRKDAPQDGAEIFAPGYVHLGPHNDERYCRQIVAESLRAREWRGRTTQEWVAHGENHFHDCRIYNAALFAHLGGDRMTADQWKDLAQRRGVKPEAQKELFQVASLPAEARPAAINEPGQNTQQSPVRRTERSKRIF